MLILIEQVLKQYWYVSRCANNELAPCILKLKNNTEWKQTTVTEITENRFGNFRFWGENMLDRFGFFSFSSPGVEPDQTAPRSGSKLFVCMQKVCLKSLQEAAADDMNRCSFSWHL